MHSVNVEQTSRGSSLVFAQKKSLMVKNRRKEIIKRHHHEVSSSKDSDDSGNNDTLTHKTPKVNFHHSCVQSAVLAHRDDDKVSGYTR